MSLPSMADVLCSFSKHVHEFGNINLGLVLLMLLQIGNYCFLS